MLDLDGKESISLSQCKVSNSLSEGDLFTQVVNVNSTLSDIDPDEQVVSDDDDYSRAGTDCGEGLSQPTLNNVTSTKKVSEHYNFD